MKFIMLTTINGEKTIVKTERIQCITDYISFRSIFFAEDDFVEVLEDVETIYKMLEDKEK